MLTIEHIYVSPGHNYFGRHGQAPGQHALLDVDQVECVAGSGLRGDRFFEYKPDYKGQVTLFAAEVFDELLSAFGLRNVGPSALRRNLIVRGVPDLTTFVGAEFELQGVRLLGTEECRPCYWMDQALAPGAEQWLKGRGGLRCRVLSTGVLRRDGLVARSAA
jgi:MOSC domain-containing protein YiiM